MKSVHHIPLEYLLFPSISVDRNAEITLIVFKKRNIKIVLHILSALKGSYLSWHETCKTYILFNQHAKNISIYAKWM